MFEGKIMNGIEKHQPPLTPVATETKNKFTTSLESRLAMLKENTKTTSELKNTGLEALKALDTTNTLEQVQNWQGFAALAKQNRGKPQSLEAALNGISA